MSAAAEVMKVTRKADGEACVINVSDFSESLHELPGGDKPKRKAKKKTKTS